MGAAICALGCAANVWCLAYYGMNPINAASAAFCGLMAIICTLIELQ